ncbi:MAG TPA: FG-GAP-like repeat-containing protein, partial [Chitinophagaceae bacterium]
GNEDGIFTDKSMEWGTGEQKGYFNGAAWADLDNDGDVDLIVNSINAPAVIYKNNTKDKKFLTLGFEGDSLNKAGIGAKAWLYAGGKLQYQQLMLTRGFQSSSESRLHFGLNDQTSADSLLIVWPDQKYQVIKNIQAGKQLIIKHTDAGGSFVHQAYFPKAPEMLSDISGTMGINWKHRENEFVDFNVQYLIPHQLSVKGPKIAVGDVNKDGLDDFYVCGSSAQNGVMMLQSADGKFSAIDTSVFRKQIPCEEVDAVFFDANKDGWPDLYVVSGGNEFENNSPSLADRLFLNDGKGHFGPGSGLPQMPANKSCVSAADVDQDGDNDLFIGGLSSSKAYGIAQDSWLLLNDGKGNFTIAGEDVIKLRALGMVTSASFADLNKDGWMDLVIAGEWMPVKTFINNKGIFKPADLEKSTGLWQTIYTSDINGDGHMDILAGNWGHNSKLYAGKNGPLKLFVKDFDKNGSIEQILAYTIDGKEYPFLGKDELERPLPTLKKGYLTYSEVAGKTVDYILYNLFEDYIELKAEVVSSSCFLNDGKGNFKRVNLPNELQLAPLTAFAPYNNQPNTFFAAGNFYGVIPYEGRYDAMLPGVFSYDAGTSAFNQLTKLPGMEGEVRDAKWLNYAGGKKLLLLARNNDSLRFLIKQ